LRGSIRIESDKISNRYDSTGPICVEDTADCELFGELLYFPGVCESGVGALREKCGIVGSVALDDRHVKREVTLAIRLESG
jgi:hypothetical protein